MEKRKSKITMKEVQKHTTDDDCWIVLRRKVYDITDFLHDHPAGPDILLMCAGTDATEAFVKSAHSVDAEDMLDEFYIGDLAGKAPLLLSPFDVPNRKYRRPTPAAYQRADPTQPSAAPPGSSAMRLAEIMRDAPPTSWRVGSVTQEDSPASDQCTYK